MIQIKIDKRKKQTLLRQYKKCECSGDVIGLVRTHALLLYFLDELPIKKISEMLQKSGETIRLWIKEYILYGAKSVKISWSRGRQPKMSKQELVDLKKMLMDSPEKYGFLSGGWNSAMVAELIFNHFQVKYSVKYIPQLLKRIRFSYQRACFVLGEKSLADRLEWLNVTWPKIFKKAKKTGAQIFFEDESSFAMWGSLSYSWAPIGYQPRVKTKGIRKGYKIFGLIEYFSGKLIYQGQDDKLNSNSYIKFLKYAKKRIKGKAIIIHDGAKYHKSAATTQYIESIPEIVFYNLPAYSPDFNPIEGLWRKVKRAATHLVYFPSFEDLIFRVELELQNISKNKGETLALFGFYTKPEKQLVF